MLWKSSYLLILTSFSLKFMDLKKELLLYIESVVSLMNILGLHCTCPNTKQYVNIFSVTQNNRFIISFSSVQSLNHVCLCDPMDCGTPGFPVHHQLPELAKTHVHQSVTSSNHLILCYVNNFININFYVNNFIKSLH